jgi:hypothetical protein
MPALFALATSVGVLAVLATWLFGLEPLADNNLQVWIAFIAWGCHFHSGGGTKGSTTTIVCMSWGALVGTMAAPVAVGIGAAIICLSSKIPLLATIPASVYGFASIAGLTLLADKMHNSEGVLLPHQAIIPTILSVILGAAFGFVSELVANALTKKTVADTTV